MNIKRLAINGFLSYQQADINFNGIGMACISGHNGAGKSSLLDAITWALFGQARRKDDAVINTRCDGASVCVEFEYEGCLYQVQRVKKKDHPASLELRIFTDGKWRAITEATMRETEAAIQTILSMDYETFVNASFFLQGKADQFTQQRPRDRKRILINILGLDAWEEYKDIAARHRRKLEASLTELDGRTQEILTELEEEPIRVRRLEDVQAKLSAIIDLRREKEKRVEELRSLWSLINQHKTQVHTSAAELKRMKERRDNINQLVLDRTKEMAQHESVLSRSADIEAKYARWLKARQRIADLDSVSGDFHQLQTKRAEVLSRLEAIEQQYRLELQGLVSRSDEMARVQSGLTELLQARDEKQDLVGKLNEHLSKVQEIERQLEAIRTSNADARAENPRLKDEMLAIKRRIDHLGELTGDTPCPLCEQSLSEHSKEKLISELNAQGKVLGDRFRANERLLADTAEEMHSLEQQLLKFRTAETQARSLEQEIAVLSTKIETSRQSLDEWQPGLNRMRELEAILETGSYGEDEKASLSAIDAELSATGYDITAHDLARQDEKSTRQAEELMRELHTAQAAVAPVSREIQSLKDQLANLDAEFAGKEEEYDLGVSELAKLQEQAPDPEEEERQLQAARDKESQATLELGGAKQKVEVLESLKTRYKEMNDTKAAISKSVAQLLQLEKAFGKDGIPALLIEQALPAIEAKANEILDGLSGGEISVKFQTQREFKDRKRNDLRETLDILISTPIGEREYETLSGGEAFRVNFAIRLALSEILSRRAGARLQMLVIDEGFGSQDENGRQRLVEAINAVAGKFEKILVVTHIDALKDAFPNRIKVSKGEEGSTISVV